NIDSKMISIESEYSRTEGSDFETVDDFNLSTSLTKPGSYQIFSRVVYNDDINEVISEETMMQFNIKDIMKDYVAPNMTVNNASNNGTEGSFITVTINTNVNPTDVEELVYVYYLENITNGKEISVDSDTAIESIDSSGRSVLKIKLDTGFLEYGMNDVKLSVTFDGNQFLYDVELDYIKPIIEVETSNKLLGPLKYHRSDSTSNSSKYNNASLTT